ncbi:hypothetical protein R77567_01613 [Ralstonia sp. LMG 32965]|uniref:Bacteriophage tail tape measure N-terminal domain-containing protein n=1 Tax=Ralstonia flatus TaxID=3058601 RepID=A0AAD2BY71_9RALS|nr:hypothetical protein [Ralstonia sp. LMG 32965]CAJ0862058.1 hypothetical protein R77567_01613 [Ralstonia sp. LMG 32965]
MTDEVKTRFSAEGVSDIIAATKAIRDEAKKTGEEGSAAFDKLTGFVKKYAASLVAAFSIGAIVAKFKALTNEVQDNALAMGKLAKQTGLSTDAIQVYMKAAGPSAAAQEALTKGLQKFSITAGQAELGSKKMTVALAEMGVKSSDFSKMNMDEKLQMLTSKLAGIEDPAQRAAIAVTFFGKGAQGMMAALDKVAHEGFDTLLGKLKEMGLYLDKDTIAAMGRVKRDMKEMGETSKGLATQFLTGLMPAVSDAMNGIVRDTNKGASGFLILGQKVGWAVDVVAQGMRLIGTAIGEALANASVRLERFADAFAHVFKGDWAYVRNMPAAPAPSYEATEKQFNKLKETFTNGPPKLKAPEPKEVPITEVQKDMGALGHARLALINAMLDAELRIFEANSKLKEETERHAYEQGKISLAAYFADRSQLLNAKVDEEISILRRRRAAVASTPASLGDDGSHALQTQAELKKIDAEITVKEIERQTQLGALKAEELREQRRLSEEHLQAQQKLLTIAGKRADAARLALQLEKERLALELQKSGAPQSDINSALDTYDKQARARIDYDETRREADATLTTLSTRIRTIQDQVRSGVLFPIQAEQEIIDLERSRLPVLEETAKKLEILAEKTNDPAIIAQAEQFRQKINEISTAVDTSGQHMAALKVTAENAFQGGLSTFLFDIATHAKTAGEAIEGFALTFIQSLAKIESEFLAKQFVKWMAGEGAGGSGATGILSAIGSLFGGGDGAGAASAAPDAAGGVALTTAGTTLTTAGAGLTAAAAQLTAAAAVMQASGAASGGGGLLASLGSASAIAVAAATGGHIRGPGTSTSDSIPAMLSDGEFVVNAGAVSKPGMLALLHAINGTPGIARATTPTVHRYAQGGMVAGGGGGGSMKIVNVPDASLLGQHLESAAGEQQIINIISRHPSRIRQALG